MELQELINNIAAATAENTAILKEIRQRQLNENNAFCTTKEAIAILGIGNPRLLKFLADNGKITKPVGGRNKYHKQSVKDYARLLADKVEVLPNLKIIYKNGK
jgi:hypothetical protein